MKSLFFPLIIPFSLDTLINSNEKLQGIAKKVKKEKHIDLYIDEKLCKGVDGCGLCIRICPKNVYKRADKLTEKGIRPPVPVNIQECTGCQLCMMYCPDFAIVVET